MTQSRKYPDLKCTRPVVLVGMMGVGKTTIGRRLAPQLDLPFYDADHEIEKAAGMSVSDLFKTHGEASFREGEARVIKRLLEGPAHVLATGGGALTNEETRTLIAENTLSIWIDADIETIIRRAGRRDTRPLLQDGDPRETLLRLSKEREEFYRAADIKIQSQPGPHANTVALILEKLDSSPWLLSPREENE